MTLNRLNMLIAYAAVIIYAVVLLFVETTNPQKILCVIGIVVGIIFAYGTTMIEREQQ